MKEDASVPRPFSLAFLQLDSQSVLGEASSALDLMYSILLSADSRINIYLQNPAKLHHGNRVQDVSGTRLVVSNLV